MTTNWKDVVFLDLIGVEGLTLTQALYKYADANDLHDELDGVCHCVVCQTLAPMAGKLEQSQADLLAACKAALCDLTSETSLSDTVPMLRAVIEKAEEVQP